MVVLHVSKSEHLNGHLYGNKGPAAYSFANTPLQAAQAPLAIARTSQEGNLVSVIVVSKDEIDVNKCVDDGRSVRRRD